MIPSDSGITGSGPRLRPAQPADARMVFEWRNSPYIVQRSSSQSVVDWKTHERWYAESLRSKEKRLMYVIEEGSVPVGLVRFDRAPANGCVISVYLSEQFTGRGLGVEAIRQGCRAVFEDWGVEEVRACVRRENTGAQSAFSKAGFVGVESTSCPTNHVAMVLRESR